MSRNKLFFIGLAVVAVLYFVAVGGNAFHGDESPSNYQTEQQQSNLVEPYKRGGLKLAADFFEPFTAEIDIFAEIANNDPPSSDRCTVSGTGKDRAIVLSQNDNACFVNLSPSDDGYREATLFFNYDEPGAATRGGTLRPQLLGRPQLERLHRFPPHQIVTATVERLQMTLTMNENKPGIKEIRASQTQKIAVRENGGQLKLRCLSCSRPIYVRAK